MKYVIENFMAEEKEKLEMLRMVEQELKSTVVAAYEEVAKLK